MPEDQKETKPKKKSYPHAKIKASALAGRRKPRYNWDALKLEFMQGPWETTEDFKRFKGIPPGGVNARIVGLTKGWSKEKKALITLAAKKASLTLLEDKVEEIRKVRERQAKLARFMQLKGAEGLKTTTPVSADEARKLIATGMEQERNALGMSEKGGNQNLTQVNVNLPKTRFDELLDGQDFDGLLKIIADVRRERARRLGTGAVKQSETES